MVDKLKMYGKIGRSLLIPIVGWCYFVAVANGLAPNTSSAQSSVPQASDTIGGMVSSSNGPEAGVWVIAERGESPHRYIKIVVTDDQGRYLLPDLPGGQYKLWVRGYGLVDSKPIMSSPGENRDLKAVPAPSAQDAAQYFPPDYWLALMHTPKPEEFPGTGPQGNQISPALETQQMWLSLVKDQCQICHQFGDKATREAADPSVAGWEARLKMERPANDQAIGNRGHMASDFMQYGMAQFGKRGIEMYADWTTRIAKGEYPKESPPRPQGVERNIVLTLWDYGNARFIHDVVSTDRRSPSHFPYGPVYGAGNFTGTFQIFDPKTGENTEVGYGIENGKTTFKHDIDAYPHNPMLDASGRLWLADIGPEFLPPKPDGSARRPLRPDYCTDGTLNRYAKLYPQPGQAQSTAVVYDPKSTTIDGIPLCFKIHHLMFGVDSEKDVLYFSGDTSVMGWVDTKVWDKTHDAAKSQGWCPMVLNTKEHGGSGGGSKPDWNEPGGVTMFNQSKGGGHDPTKNTRLNGFLYGLDANPKDGSMWFAKTGPFPNGLIRFERGSHPPETCKTEFYEPPLLADGRNYAAYDARGVAMDSKGVAWMAFGSGQWGSFDRSKCKVFGGPAATGQQCPEGWKIYEIPGPRMMNTVNTAADYHYLVWLDQANTLGLGKDVPIAPGTTSDSLVALNPETGRTVHFRVPYPMGFYSRGLDGRIDDPSGGWKGRGLWATFSNVPVWHQEGGDEGKGPELVHFQLRPSPLSH